MWKSVISPLMKKLRYLIPRIFQAGVSSRGFRTLPENQLLAFETGLVRRTQGSEKCYCRMNAHQLPTNYDPHFQTMAIFPLTIFHKILLITRIPTGLQRFLHCCALRVQNSWLDQWIVPLGIAISTLEVYRKLWKTEYVARGENYISWDEYDPSCPHSISKNSA